MQQSMTGFTNLTAEYENKKITIDVRSLNSKSLDVNIRLPFIYKDIENDIRQLVAKHLIRGKIDIFINYEWIKQQTSFKINTDIIESYYNDLKKIKDDLQLLTYEPDWFSVLLKIPDVVQQTQLIISDEEKKALLNFTEEAILKVVEFRKKEGDYIIKDIINRINLIENYLNEIEMLEPLRTENIKNKLNKNLKNLLANEEIDKNRFEQEIIYYLEKMDITEERVRIRSHCNFFKEVAIKEPYAGRKLNFIAQELTREINTLGVKSQDFKIQQKVVMMKDELEKVKEQLMNVL
jgi:uncharacterized protein (TIGR00255 family)